MNQALDKRYKEHLDLRDKTLKDIEELEDSIRDIRKVILSKRQDLMKIAARTELLEEDGAKLIRKEDV